MLLIPVAVVTSPADDLKEAVRKTRPARHATTWEIPRPRRPSHRCLLDLRTPFIGAAGYRGFRKVAREILEPGALVVQ